MDDHEGWLKKYADTCRLKIVKMENWKSEILLVAGQALSNLLRMTSLSACIRRFAFEATNVSGRVGTYYPFQVLGFPDPKYGNFTFTLTSLPGFDTNPLQKDKVCYGIDLREYPKRINLAILPRLQ